MVVKKAGKIFLGAKVLPNKDRFVFREKVNETIIKRCRIALGALLILQIINLITDFGSPIYSEQISSYYHLGIIFIVSVSTIFFLLFSVKPIYSSFNTAARTFLIRLLTGLIIVSSLPFIYSEASELGSVSTYAVTVLLVNVLPIMSLTETLCTTVPLFATTLLIVSHFDITAASYKLLFVITVFSVIVSQIQFSYVFNVFCERRKLSQANSVLGALAETDPLTGLLNRRGLEIGIDALAARSRRCDDTIAAIMVDIDMFKLYNDTFLHHAGDECLRKVASALKSCSQRSTDIVARYGGEEFVIVVQNTNEIELPAFALKLKKAVEELKIPFAPNRGMPYVTVSVGAALTRINEKDPFRRKDAESTIVLADQQLYLAKKSGRNCIFFADDSY